MAKPRNGDIAISPDLRRDTTLTATQKLVLLVIRDYQRAGNTYTDEDLADEVGVDRTTAMRARRALQEAGRIHDNLGVHNATKAGVQDATKTVQVASKKVQDATNPSIPITVLKTTTLPQSQPADTLFGNAEERKSNRKSPKAMPVQTQLVEWFYQRFQEVRGIPHPPKFSRDTAKINGLLKTVKPDEIKAAADAMLADEWWGPKASIPVLDQRFPEFLQASKGVVPKSAPRDQAPAPSGIAYRSFEEVMREQGILK